MGTDRTKPLDSMILRRIPYTFRRQSVKDRDLTAPPGTPSEGDRYIVATGGSGDWSGHDLEIAEWHAAGASAAAWLFEDPWRGYTIWIEDEETSVVWDGDSWEAIVGQKIADGQKLYLSNTTETYLLYNSGAHSIELWVEGEKATWWEKS